MAKTEDQEPQLHIVDNAITAVHLKDRRICNYVEAARQLLTIKAKKHRCEGCNLLRTTMYGPNINGTVILNTTKKPPHSE